MEISVKAQYVVVSPQEILSPGIVHINSGLIKAVECGKNAVADFEFPDRALIPGLINSHCHLEFSDIRQPLPAGRTFPDWISSVIRHRISLAKGMSPDELSEHRVHTLRSGLRELSETGTAVVADIVSYPWQPSDLPTISQDWHRAFDAEVVAPKVIALPEILGLNSERFSQTSSWAFELSELQDRATDGLEIGLSPHSPYSVNYGLLVEAMRNQPSTKHMAIHLAESKEELEYLQTGQGPFRDSFAALGLPIPDALASLVDMLKILSKTRHGLVVHGNYLRPPEVDFISKHKHLSVVYCPRTHQHFRHEMHPCKELLNAGIRVVLGTDSRASTPDLDLWQEVVAARQQNAELTAPEVLSMVTESAATALGLESQYGTIAKGKRAFMNVSASLSHSPPEEQLLDFLTLHPMRWTPLHILLGQ